MKNRVKIEKTKFHVDTVNRVVVCELFCNMQLNKHPAWIVIDADMWNKSFPDITYEGRFTVTAKARCNILDTFDEQKGKRIAEGRAKAKMLGIAGRVWASCYRKLADLAYLCDKTAEDCLDASYIEEYHVRELIS